MMIFFAYNIFRPFHVLVKGSETHISVSTHTRQPSDNVMQSSAALRLTLELPSSISPRPRHYLATATIPPPISPLWLRLNPALSPPVLICILFLSLNAASSHPRLSPLPSSAFSFLFCQPRVCQIIIPASINPFKMFWNQPCLLYEVRQKQRCARMFAVISCKYVTQ